jgi:hypothetical protein
MILGDHGSALSLLSSLGVQSRVQVHGQLYGWLPMWCGNAVGGKSYEGGDAVHDAIVALHLLDASVWKGAHTWPWTEFELVRAEINCQPQSDHAHAALPAASLYSQV